MSGTELITGMGEVINYLKQLEEEKQKLKKELEKWQGERLEFGCNVMKWKDDIDTILYGDKDGCSGCWDQRISDIKKLEEENKKLKQKATAWDIITSGDWEYVRDLCDKEMCKDLIACGECKEEDFEGYECYEEEDDIEDNDPEEYGEYTWKEGLTAEEIAKGDTIDPLTGEPIKK